MSLTGTPLLVIAILAAAAALLLPLVLWTRIGGPAFVRGISRLLMLGFAQVTAILVVFLLVNNANGLYDTWGDLLGGGDHVNAAPDLGPDGTGGRNAAAEPKVKQQFEPYTNKVGKGVVKTMLKGQVSGVEGDVAVWLPPQYDDPEYRDKTFPVVELLPGYPGSIGAWFGTLKAQEQLTPMMERGEVAPFILVSPRTTLLGGKDTGCANVPGVVNADTWLSVDVRKMVTDNFRAATGADGWAVAGYSAGAHCAAKLAIEHPDRYRAGVDLSGYNDPAAEKDSITAKDPKLRQESNPLWILKNAKTPPHVALYVSGERTDGYNDGLALKSAAKPPTAVTVVKLNGGGHASAVWKSQVPEVFRWLTREMGAGAKVAGRQGV
ncbi:esterase family protein [Streptomyces sp. ASQP_92]|uniref:alpha/beta hydrolase n=1 Tax=Streptomyces sp. ASQP_92 TaxID=2979116 RepID=UPI0021C1D828|nr:esterase family protein [Streptomyces sp. ASQP_92]MCT9089370.1 esterase family protein [Streptomyces sp. ASQP_92]